MTNNRKGAVATAVIYIVAGFLVQFAITYAVQQRFHDGLRALIGELIVRLCAASIGVLTGAMVKDALGAKNPWPGWVFAGLYVFAALLAGPYIARFVFDIFVVLRPVLAPVAVLLVIIMAILLMSGAKSVTAGVGGLAILVLLGALLFTKIGMSTSLYAQSFLIWSGGLVIKMIMMC